MTTPPRLLELARAATPGPWTVHADPLWVSAVDPDNDGEIFTVVDFEHRRHNERANAAWIAAANPAAIEALCSRLEELEAERVEVLAVLDKAMMPMPHKMERGAMTETGYRVSLLRYRGLSLEVDRENQAARIAALEAGLREACEIADEWITEAAASPGWAAGDRGAHDRIAELLKLSPPARTSSDTSPK